MRKERKIIILSLCCVFLDIPLAFLAILYGLVGFTFVLYLPLLLMSIVLIYGAFDVKRLVVNNEREEAGALVVILLALLLIGFIIFALSLNMLNNYGGNLNYPPGVM
jgi:hypothetical protein